MFKVGICGKEQVDCSYLEKTVLQYAEGRGRHFETEIFCLDKDLCRYLQQGNRLDILFLDVELIEMTGAEVGCFIRNRLENRNMQIIYISEKEEDVRHLLKTQPLDFLIKPIKQEHVITALEAAEKILKKDNIIFRYHQGKEYYGVPYGDIIYFISNGRKLQIITSDGVKEFYGRLKVIIPGLPEDFLLIHNSYVINVNFVRRYNYEEVELMNGAILTVSRPYRKCVRQKISRFWKEEHAGK